MNKLEMLPDSAKNMGPNALLVAYAIVHTEEGKDTQVVMFERIARTTQLSPGTVLSAISSLIFAGVLNTKLTLDGMQIEWRKHPNTGRSYKEAFGGAA